MSKYNKTYMECLEIAATRLGTPELAIDIQFAHEDKHYELMQTAAELYLYLSDLHKHSVMQGLPTDKEIRAAATDSTMHQTKTDMWAIDMMQLFFEKGARWAITKMSSSPTVGKAGEDASVCDGK